MHDRAKFITDERAVTEFKERLKALVYTTVYYAKNRTDGGETDPVEDKRLREEVRAILFKVTGQSPTEEQIDYILIPF